MTTYYLIQNGGGKILLEPSDGVSAIKLHDVGDVADLYSRRSRRKFWEEVNARRILGKGFGYGR